ncbi:hypothetical protein ACGFX7_06320 [Streptomyces harbinensis]|uniref:hypothetical protein n=1 Tax=Streptomyces harbinensis TaxID=1176198 RepID=UPI003720134C
MTTPALGDDPAEVTVDGAVWSRTGITANGRHLYVPRDTPFERFPDKTLPALVATGHTVVPRHPAEGEVEQLRHQLRSLKADYRRAVAEARGRKEYGERLAAQLKQLGQPVREREEPAAQRSASPRYPLMVQLPGGRVRHAAREGADGRVFTLCRKAGRPVSDGSDLPYCRACADRPNPISQQSGH